MASNAANFNNANQNYLNQLRAQQGILGGFENQNLAGISSGLSQYGAATDQLQNPDQNSYLGKSQQEAQSTMDQYQGLLSGIAQNPGYTQPEQAGMREAAVAPISTAYGTAQYQNGVDAARTGNAGAATANNAALARSKARDMSTALSGLQQGNANARMAGQQTALNASALPGQYAAQTLSGQQANTNLMQFPSTLNASLYGTNLNAQQNTLDQQGQATNMYLQRAQKPGFLSSTASQVVGGLTGAGSKLAAIA